MTLLHEYCDPLRFSRTIDESNSCVYEFLQTFHLRSIDISLENTAVVNAAKVVTPHRHDL